MSFASMSMGQYVPLKSYVHRLDPRAKLLLLMIFMVMAFSSETYFSVGCCAVFLCGVVYLSEISWGLLLRSSRPALFLVLFTFIFNFTALFFWNDKTLQASLQQAAFVAVRLLVLMLFALLLPLTTAPLELADGLERIFLPFTRFGFPANECAMMIGIALRFIPLLMEETDRIVRAQLSRGAQMDQGGLLRRITAFFPVLIPLFIIIFRRADELALAMEARGYAGGAGRTRMRPLRWKMEDTIATISTIFMTVVFFMARNCYDGF